MNDFYIRTMEMGELRFFFERIKRDFPVGEYPPYDILAGHIRDKLQDGLVYCSGKQDLAYSICAASTDYVLLSLFAVLPDYRDQGVGTAFLDAIKVKYDRKQAVIGEVERPELASGAGELKKRQKRIHFYERAGYQLVPNIDYSIWDVPMYLMVLPLNAAADTITENIGTIMYQVYVQLMGEGYMHKMVLNESSGGKDHDSEYGRSYQ